MHATCHFHFYPKHENEGLNKMSTLDRIHTIIQDAEQSGTRTMNELHKQGDVLDLELGKMKKVNDGINNGDDTINDIKSKKEQDDKLKLLIIAAIVGFIILIGLIKFVR
jgi:hypothetical protein